MTAADSTLPLYATSPYKHGTGHYHSLLESFGTLSQGKEDPRKRKNIAILGAGMAGLTAGFLLTALGHDVRIYEASNTVGGRVKTLRDRFTAGFYAEAGAMRIPSHHTLALDLIETFDLPCLVFPAACPHGNALYYINNQHATFGQYEREKPDFGFRLQDWERGRAAAELLNDSILRYLSAKGWTIASYQQLNDDSALADVEAIFKHLDKLSLYDFLREFAHVGRASKDDHNSEKLSLDGANYICAVLALEMSMSSSMAYLMHMLRTFFVPGNLYQIDDGMTGCPRLS